VRRVPAFFERGGRDVKIGKSPLTFVHGLRASIRRVKRRRLSAWLALLAIAAQAAWPVAATAAQPLALQGSICGVAGRAPAPDPQSAACRLHCALGFLGGDRFVTPSAGQAVFSADVPVLRLPRPAIAARGGSRASSGTHARAPPPLS